MNGYTVNGESTSKLSRAWLLLSLISRSKKVRVVVVGLCALGAIFTFYGFSNGTASSPIANLSRSPLDWLAGRGPGMRVGPLTQTKVSRRYVARLPNVPPASEPVVSLSSFFAPVPPVEELAGSEIPDFGVPELDIPLPPRVARGKNLPEPTIERPYIFGPPALPGVRPPPGISPVPEPSTWLMLVLGMGILGVRLRRPRRVAVPA